MDVWKIRVPTEKPDCLIGRKRHFSLKHHRRWDAEVVRIAGGLTLHGPTIGYWVGESGIFRERMITVEISCDREQIEKIMDLTAKHYAQQAVFAYKVSEEVLIKNY